MKKERMLAYQMAQRLSLEEIENVAGSFGHYSGTKPTFKCGYPCDVEVSWDL